MKKFLAVLVTVFMISSQISVFANWNITQSEYADIVESVLNPQNAEPIKIIINGKVIPFDQAPIFVEDNVLMVPVRAIAEGLGKNVQWNQGSETVVIQKGISTSVFEIGNNRAYSHEISQLELEARIVNNRTLIPLKTISDVFGADASYDSAANAVIVTCEDLSDDDILKDFRRTGFLKFNYFGDTFLKEHGTGDWLNSAAWLNALGHIRDWGKRVFTGGILNYGDDCYKREFKKIIVNLSTSVDEEYVNAWESDILKKCEDAGNITYDSLKTAWEKEWSGQTFELSNWDEAAIGKYLKTFNDSLGNLNTAIKWGNLGVKELGYLMADYTQSQSYIEVLKKAFENDEKVDRVVEELEREYSNGYAKVLSDLSEQLQEEIEDRVADIALDVVGGSVKSLYDRITFAIEGGVDILGGTNYADNVQDAVILSVISNNLSWLMDEHMDKVYDLASDSILSDAKKKDWNELKTIFEITKASHIEEYKCMMEVTDDPIERIYLRAQLDLLDRVHISKSIPTSAKDMFYFSKKIENPTLEGSAPGVVTTDGTYMYYPINGFIYKEDLLGGNRTPVYRTGVKLSNEIGYIHYVYKNIQFSNGNLYCEGLGFGGFYEHFKINLSDLSRDRSINGDDENFIRKNFDTEPVLNHIGLLETAYDIQKYNDEYWYKYRWMPFKSDLRMDNSDGTNVYLQDIRLYNYCVYNGYIYYIKDGDLCKYDIKYHIPEIVFENITESLSIAENCKINTVGDWLYIYNEGDHLSGPGRIFRAYIDDWTFEELKETEYEKTINTNNKIVESENKTTPTPIPTPTPTPTVAPTSTPIPTPTPPLTSEPETGDSNSNSFVKTQYGYKLDFNQDGIPEEIYVEPNGEYAQYISVYNKAKGESEFGLCGEFMQTNKLEECYIVKDTNSGRYYIESISSFSDARDITHIYALNGENFECIDAWGIFVNKDIPGDYKTLYRIGTEAVELGYKMNGTMEFTENEYNSYKNKYSFEQIHYFGDDI